MTHSFHINLCVKVLISVFTYACAHLDHEQTHTQMYTRDSIYHLVLHKGSSTNIDLFLEKIFVRLEGGGEGVWALFVSSLSKNIELYLWTGTVQTCSL